MAVYQAVTSGVTLQYSSVVAGGVAAGLQLSRHLILVVYTRLNSKLENSYSAKSVSSMSEPLQQNLVKVKQANYLS